MKKLEEKPKLPTITFSSFDEGKVKQAFGLEIAMEDSDDFLTTWKERATNIEISEFANVILEKLYTKIKLYARNWNEQELRDKVIAQLTELVDFDNFNLSISAFSERTLKTVIKGNIIQGKVDWMVASGQFSPESPFFFILVEFCKNEIPTQFGKYKKEKESTDPVGQLLATMVVANILNATPQQPSLFNPKPKSYKDTPIYGCYPEVSGSESFGILFV